MSAAWQMILALGLAGVLVGQERSDARQIAKLIRQLGDEKTRESASDQLTTMGREAADGLLRVVEREKHPMARVALLTLARMPQHADSIVSRLVSVPLADLHLSALGPFYRALAELVPYAVLSRDQLFAVEQTTDSVLDIDPDSDEISPHLRAQFLGDVNDEAWRLLGRITMVMPLAETPITAAPAQRDVVDLRHALVGERLFATDRRLLEHGSTNTHPSADGTILAVQLLGQRGSQARIALPALRELLLNTDPREALPINVPFKRTRECVWLAIRVRPDKLAELESSYMGEPDLFRDTIWRTPLECEVKTAVAEAMERIAPDDPAIAVAVAYRLLHHPDAAERQNAVRVLGEFGEKAADAVPLLTEGLETGETSALPEAITALGMIGPAAKDAIPTLEKLATHEDKQIAERAKAALRQIQLRAHEDKQIAERAEAALRQIKGNGR